MPPADADRSDGRQRILDAAARLFLEQGYAETTLRGIAAAAGIKAGSVYYHFDSKDDLLEEILGVGIEAVTTAFDRVATSLPADTGGRERLRAHIRSHLGALFDHGAYTAAHVTVFPFAPAGVRTASVPVRDGYEARWTNLLRDLQATGVVRKDIDVTMSRLLLLGAMNSSVEWFDPSGGRTLDDLAEGLADQVWGGIATPTATRRPAPPTETSE